jgi:hypothetical protein
MTGYQYLQRLTLMSNSEHPNETWMDKRTTFDFVYQGACEFARRTQCLRAVQNITTLAPVVITGATQTNPCAVTAASHGLTTGDYVLLKDLGGMTALNDRRFIVTKSTADVVTLDGIDATGLSAYTSGGTCYLLSYTLNYDYAGLYQLDVDTGDGVVKYYRDGASARVYQRDYDEMAYADGGPDSDSTTVVSAPQYFAVAMSVTPTAISSSTTSAAAHTGGESSLTDTQGAFLTTNALIKPGDEVINKTRNRAGYVLAVTGATNLKTAMFDAAQPISSYAGWETSDAYAIFPRRRYQLVLDSPLEHGGGTITIPYVKLPDPVYSDYGFYSLPVMGDEAILNYALWLYAYRNEEVNYGNRFYINWERMVTDSVSILNRMTNRVVKRPKYYV